jgi:hypothetical protein
MAGLQSGASGGSNAGCDRNDDVGIGLAIRSVLDHGPHRRLRRYRRMYQFHGVTGVLGPQS